MTTSLIDPAVLDVVVGELATPCECTGKEMHDHPNGCERPAKWMVRLQHAGMDPNEDCKSPVLALCNDCLEFVRYWAEQAVNQMRAYGIVQCPRCGGPTAHVSDLITSVVAL